MAKIDYPVPELMKDLKLDQRGYPIPYFATIKDGKPDFRFQDIIKQEEALRRHLCSICGKRLYDDFSYVISGPMGYKNKVSSDAAMHLACADYSIHVCPHLVLQKAERRADDDPRLFTPAEQGLLIDKPAELFLIKIRTNYNIRMGPNKRGLLLRYVPVKATIYHYVNGLLELKTQNP
jgi:hypothetical protein